MPAITSHQLALEIPEQSCPDRIRIWDASVYADNIAVECETLEILIPGYTTVVTFADTDDPNPLDNAIIPTGESLTTQRQARGKSEQELISEAFTQGGINLSDSDLVRAILQQRPAGIEDDEVFFNTTPGQGKIVKNTNRVTNIFKDRIDESLFKLLENNFIFMNASSGTAGQQVSMNERMRITGAGEVAINSTAALSSSMLSVKIPMSVTANAFVCQPDANGTANAAVFVNSSGSNAGFIQYTATTTTYSTSSDYRLKENIQPLENGLERLNNLKPVKFDWKNEDTSSEGFIAHEVQEVFPDAVSGEKDGEDMQGMDYGRITPLLVKAIQEQQEQIEQLKTEIQTLKGE